MKTQSFSWVRVERYCELSGEPLNTVHDRIRSGQWAACKHYKRTGPRTLWVNLEGVNEWVTQQPHVEAACPPTSKSAQKKNQPVTE